MIAINLAFQSPLNIPAPSQSKQPSRCKTKTSNPYHPCLRPPSSCTIRTISRSSLHVEWNKLSIPDFDRKLRSNSLPLCLIGMSNCGKSYWSLQLHLRRGFRMRCVDDHIERAIKPELTALGYSGIDGLAAWMGFPTDKQFGANQARYLELEESITGSAPSGPGNTVLDTTGSVCYLSEETLRRLRAKYLVVHLEASDDMLSSMTERYFTTPKPVVWGDCFNLSEGETSEEALRRCYPDLLRERRQRYRKIAHVNVPASKSSSKEMTMDGFIALLKQGMRMS